MKRFLSIAFFLVILFNFRTSNSLGAYNTFGFGNLGLLELSFVGIGAGLIHDQYFDDSLEQRPEFSNKLGVINKFYDNRSAKINSDIYFRLPLQERLLIIEELHLLNN